jgi:hypothetical protein
MSGFEENVSFVDEVSNGVATVLHFQGDELIVQRQWDATPFLKAAAADRTATEGQRWGEGRKVMHLPPAEYGRYLSETQGQSQEEKRQWLRMWAQQHPLLVSFEKYLKR